MITLRTTSLYAVILLSAGCFIEAPGSDDSGRDTDRVDTCTTYGTWEEGQYGPGDRVTDGDNVYQCQAWPKSDWCGQLGFEPPVGPAWTTAWDDLGPCDLVGPCAPITCEDSDEGCGEVYDGCGQVLDCGECIPDCTPTTCEAESAICGEIDDGCGTVLVCGECDEGKVCREALACEDEIVCQADIPREHAACGDIISFADRPYECISQRVGINGEDVGCGQEGVFCSNSLPNDPSWGALAWRPVTECDRVLEAIPCGRDDFEPNDERGEAVSLDDGTQEGWSCRADDDFYTVALAAGDVLDLLLLYDGFEEELDMELLDASGFKIRTGQDTFGGEMIRYVAPVAATVTVHVASLSDLDLAYSLKVDTAPRVGSVADLVSEAQFDTMFPARHTLYASYADFVAAADAVRGFADSGDATIDTQEIAAFLAQTAHESGELQYPEEINGHLIGYCDTSTWNDFCPCVEDESYHGRGVLQLTWNYNYCRAGEFVGKNLRVDPGLVSRDTELAWQAGLWFWMTQSGSGTYACHNSMLWGLGFGETTKTINGALECGGRAPDKVAKRANYYNDFSVLLGVEPVGPMGC